MAFSQIPTPSAPLTDPTSGRVTVPWFQFFLRMQGAVSAGSGASAEGGYVVDVADPTLPNARVATDSLTVLVDVATPSVMQWHAAGYWAVITNGDGLSPEVLFDSEGDAVMGFVPVPGGIV